MSFGRPQRGSNALHFLAATSPQRSHKRVPVMRFSVIRRTWTLKEKLRLPNMTAMDSAFGTTND
jgi:hypothetical protein